MTEQQVAEIDDPEAPSLSDRERCGLEFAETLILDPSGMSDAGFARLRAHFSEAEIVEMSFFVGFYNLLHRFNAVIDLDPKQGEEIVFQSLRDFQLAPGERASNE